jgi:hypothetical protein
MSTQTDCLVCGEPSKGASLDYDGKTLIWYCRAHHPLFPGGEPARGRWVTGSGASYTWVPAKPEMAGATA